MSKVKKSKTRIVHARLDEETQALLDELSEALRWNSSKVIRESLKSLASCTPQIRAKRMVGVGKFSSGITDLASNKKHLKGFGT